MNSIVTSIVIIPGVVAVLLCLLFTYLYQQSRQAYFRAWQMAWACYSIHYVLDAFRYYYPPAPAGVLFQLVVFGGNGVCIFVSTRLTRGPFRFRWYDGRWRRRNVRLACVDLADTSSRRTPDDQRRLSGSSFSSGGPAVLLGGVLPARSPEGLARLQIAGAFAGAVGGADGRFSPAIRWMEMFGSVGHVLGPVPQMLLGIAMVMVLFENERNAVQENTLALSTLGADPRRLLSAERFAAQHAVGPGAPGRRASIRAAASSALRNAGAGCCPRCSGILGGIPRDLTRPGAAEYICELAYRQGGLFTVHDLAR
jgi:hypothetical protein